MLARLAARRCRPRLKRESAHVAQPCGGCPTARLRVLTTGLSQLKCAKSTFRLPPRRTPGPFVLNAVPTAIADSDAEPDEAVLQACRAVLVPLARLAVARGLRHAQVDELLRGAFVEAALDAHADVLPHRAASRVSATSGLHRREVTRLLQARTPEVPRRSYATELFTRWLSDPALRSKGEPMKSLPRQGKAPSFESLAQSVTKDVHPRTLLEEVCRLGLAKVDEARDAVVLLRDSFVPTGDEKRMFGFLASNVGDHLSAAVSNVLGEGPRNLEQAMSASELSEQSLDRLRPAIQQQWQSVLRALAPAIQECIDEDEAEDRPRKQRLRVGMYACATPMNVVPDGPRAVKPVAKELGRRRKKS